MVIYAEKDRIITKNEKFRLDPAEKVKNRGRRQAENISENAHRGHKSRRKQEAAPGKSRDTAHPGTPRHFA